MRSYELESFIKSFILLFMLLSSVYGLFLWQSYSSKKYLLDANILQEMQLFSYNPTSDKFGVDFVAPDKKIKLFTINHTPKEIYALFEVPTADGFLMKTTISTAEYESKLNQIGFMDLKWIITFLLLIITISMGLAYYSLQPIRQALKLNKEFMKDILHDVNTPISSIIVNLKLLEKRFGEQKSINRIENNIETLGILHQNIHTYLGSAKQSRSTFELKSLIDQRFDYFRTLYPHLAFINNIEDKVQLHTQKGSIVRILDNIIGNAAKYNKSNGSVTVKVNNNVIYIEDTGIGIRNIRKVFKRHYKEGERGMGIGLHIVQQLTKKLKIKIIIKSTIGEGTSVELDISKVILS